MISFNGLGQCLNLKINVLKLNTLISLYSNRCVYSMNIVQTGNRCAFERTDEACSIYFAFFVLFLRFYQIKIPEESEVLESFLMYVQ